MNSKSSHLVTDGLFKNNPVFVILLGLCPSLGCSTRISGALAMGIGVLFVLMGSNVVISLLKTVIPNKVRIPVYIVIIASFVTVVDLLMNAYLPEIYRTMKLYIPLIVVNCIVLGRAEAFAAKNTVWHSFLDAVGMGLGFTLALVSIAVVREVLGSGSLSFPGFKTLSLGFPGAKLLLLPAGAMMVMGYLKVGVDALNRWQSKRAKRRGEGRHE